MPAFNFQKRFADAVASGEKRQTIRRGRRKPGQKLRTAPAKVGDTLTLYTGMRRKTCRKLATARCTRVRGICMTGSISMDIFVGETDAVVRLMTHDDAENLAKSDGFATLGDMLNWFESTHGLPFHGYLIEWEMV